MANNLNLQDLFLNTARKRRIVTTVFLTNGFQIRGLVKAFDAFTVLVENAGKQNLIYKHAISTLAPAEDIPLPACAEPERPERPEHPDH